MAAVAFIEPPQRDVIEKILRGHRRAADQRFASVPVGGLWHSSAPRAPPDVERLIHELDYVDIDTFLATF